MTANNPENQSAPEEKPPELSPLMRKLADRLGSLMLDHREFRGDERIHVARENIIQVCRVLRDDPDLDFDLLLDVTAIDYMGQPDDFTAKNEIWDENRPVMARKAQRRHRMLVPERGPLERFAVVYHIISTRHLHRLRIKCRVPEDDPSIASLTPIWAGANWLERETYDMYGIRFTGHPDLRRIYLYDEFVGHPLRKDYGKFDEQPIQPYVGPGAKEPRRPE
jgi:NADH-quinone oxidoreductase subunit C